MKSIYVGEDPDPPLTFVSYRKTGFTLHEFVFAELILRLGRVKTLPY